MAAVDLIRSVGSVGIWSLEASCWSQIFRLEIFPSKWKRAFLKVPHPKSAKAQENPHLATRVRWGELPTMDIGDTIKPQPSTLAITCLFLRKSLSLLFFLTAKNQCLYSSSGRHHMTPFSLWLFPVSWLRDQAGHCNPDRIPFPGVRSQLLRRLPHRSSIAQLYDGPRPLRASSVLPDHGFFSQNPFS